MKLKKYILTEFDACIFMEAKKNWDLLESSLLLRVQVTVVPYFQKRFNVKRKWFRVLVAVFFGF
ncbi:MAG: hypothetical protein ABIY35_01585 [Chitinophagaceae bacterium]